MISAALGVSMRRFLLAYAVATAILTTSTFAQEFLCSDFHKNGDNSWSPNQTTRVSGPDGSINVGPYVALRLGARLMGLDLASILDRQCGAYDHVLANSASEKG